MANTFKNKTFDGSNVSANSDMTPYTCPASTTTVVIGLTIANTTNSQITVDIKLDAQTNIFLVKNLPIPAGSAFEYMSGNKIILLADLGPRPGNFEITLINSSISVKLFMIRMAT